MNLFLIKAFKTSKKFRLKRVKICFKKRDVFLPFETRFFQNKRVISSV